MGKIDEVKEILTTLRVAMSIAFGILVVLVGNLVKRYDAGDTNILFWIGLAFGGILLIVIILIVRKISQKTREIRDL